MVVRAAMPGGHKAHRIRALAVHRHATNTAQQVRQVGLGVVLQIHAHQLGQLGKAVLLQPLTESAPQLTYSPKRLLWQLFVGPAPLDIGQKLLHVEGGPLITLQVGSLFTVGPEIKPGLIGKFKQPLASTHLMQYTIQRSNQLLLATTTHGQMQALMQQRLLNIVGRKEVFMQQVYLALVGHPVYALIGISVVVAGLVGFFQYRRRQILKSFKQYHCLSVRLPPPGSNPIDN